MTRPTKQPVYNNQCGPEGNYFASVRQSRFGVKGFKPTSKGDIKTIFGFELFGVGSDEGQTTLRLCHAYGEFNNVGAGRNWKTWAQVPGISLSISLAGISTSAPTSSLPLTRSSSGSSLVKAYRIT